MVPNFTPSQALDWLAGRYSRPIYVDEMTLDDMIQLMQNLFACLGTVVPAGETAEDLPGGFRFTNNLPQDCELTKVDSGHCPGGFCQYAAYRFTCHEADAFRMKQLMEELRGGLLEEFYFYVADRSLPVALTDEDAPNFQSVVLASW